MFVTFDDETGIANLVVWRKVFEKNRRVILSASMLAIYGKIQWEGRWFTSSPSDPAISRPNWRVGQCIPDAGRTRR